ncbi:transposase, partial [Salsuginibacillus kocurii]
MSRQKRQHFSQSFKEQIVQLRASGKPRQEILKEYGMSPSVLDKWVRQSKQGESFSERENRTTEQEELLQ